MYLSKACQLVLEVTHTEHTQDTEQVTSLRILHPFLTSNKYSTSLGYRYHQDTMSTTTTTTATATATQPTLHLSSSQALKDGVAANFGDWRDDLLRDGYAIVKGAIPRDRADGYANAMYDWLEGL